jgi:nucleotide-binding universal stress UspA family protein
MFKRVVWATDGSETADCALEAARTLVEDSAGELLTVHCEELTLPGKAGGSYPRYANEDELQSKIKRQVADLANGGVPASLELTRARVGGAAHSIVEAAETQKADVIVVATRGHTPLGGLLVGSVTQRLLHIAPCPVLVVPAKAT